MKVVFLSSYFFLSLNDVIDYFNAGRSTISHRVRHSWSRRIDHGDKAQKSISRFRYLIVFPFQSRLVRIVEPFELFVAKSWKQWNETRSWIQAIQRFDGIAAKRTTLTDYALSVAADRLVHLIESLQESLVDRHIFAVLKYTITFGQYRFGSTFQQCKDFVMIRFLHNAHAELVRAVERHLKQVDRLFAIVFHRSDVLFQKSKHGHFTWIAQGWSSQSSKIAAFQKSKSVGNRLLLLILPGLPFMNCHIFVSFQKLRFTTIADYTNNRFPFIVMFREICKKKGIQEIKLN